MDLTIHQLTQEEADTLMKTLDVNKKYYQNFYDAFHGERTHLSNRDRPWALSEQERSYYLIESYLFGVNFQHSDTIKLSSFARILPQTPHHRCASCLRHLLQHRLLPMCGAYNKRCISAALTKEGRVVFEELKQAFPSLQITPSRPYHSATILYEEGHT